MNGQNVLPTVKFLLLLLFVTVFTVSCNQSNKTAVKETTDNKHPLRTITRTEIKEFIPNGYAINADDIRSTEKEEPLYINLDSDSENEIVLILESLKRKEGANAIIKVLNFNTSTDKWEFLCADTLKKESVSKTFRVTDLNKNGLNELHIVTSSIGLNYYDGTPVILELSKNNELINLFPHSKPTEISYVFDDKNNNYYNVGYIWAEGETHWACHYFQVEVYVFDGTTYSLKEKKVTSKRYGLDPGDSRLDGCSVYDIDTILKELNLK